MAPRTPKTPDDKPTKSSRATRPASKTKPAAVMPAVAKPATQAEAKPARSAGDKAGAFDGTLKVKDLVDQVVGATGLKKPDAKKAVEATLAALGAAIAAKSGLTVPPLGKLRVVKASDGVVTLKLRLGGAAKTPGKQPLAEDGEDG